MSNEPTVPLKAASRITCSTRTVPVQVSAASAKALSISRIWVDDYQAAAIDRLTITPANKPTSRIGVNWANETTPSIVDEFVSFSTSHVARRSASRAGRRDELAEEIEPIVAMAQRAKCASALAQSLAGERRLGILRLWARPSLSSHDAPIRW